jgi:uncharacterized protein YeaO (DUF488 family)
VLITRYRPRGVRRGEETWDTWDRRLAPTTELLDQWYEKRRAGGRVVAHAASPITWSDYKRRFLAEMRKPESGAAIAEYVARARAGPVTLLCYCDDESRCHRGLVARLISRCL